MGGVDVHSSERPVALAGQPATRAAAAVDHRRKAWCPPGRVEEVVFRAAALCCGVDGALKGVADCGVHGRPSGPGLGGFRPADRSLRAELDWVGSPQRHDVAGLRILALNALKHWDGTTSGTVTNVAADSTAIREPEARLAVIAGYVSLVMTSGLMGGKGAPRFKGHPMRHIAAPWLFIPIHCFAGLWNGQRGVAAGPHGE
mmetsp:Transcript_31562/g.87001  ORF Transcript_31562/g.87001 Transcript_31562/m.87001 type:complete len:201 (-) Transcript_31562:91-693(-)